MLEAVITSLGYSDYLEQTLPHTLHHFDRVVVVTSPEDVETQRVCRQLDVQEVVTDAFRRDGAVFRKGAGINVGLQTLRREGWVAHLDADTTLLDPVPLEGLDPTCLYGAHRLRVKGLYRWQRLLRAPDLYHDLPKVPILRNKLGELCPSGYFQLWHFPTCPHPYDESSDHAGHSDWRFLKPWPPEARLVLSDFHVYHLEMPTDRRAMNWKGRRSARFA